METGHLNLTGYMGVQRRFFGRKTAEHRDQTGPYLSLNAQQILLGSDPFPRPSALIVLLPSHLCLVFEVRGNDWCLGRSRRQNAKSVSRWRVRCSLEQDREREEPDNREKCAVVTFHMRWTSCTGYELPTYSSARKCEGGAAVSGAPGFP